MQRIRLGRPVLQHLDQRAARQIGCSHDVEGLRHAHAGEHRAEVRRAFVHADHGVAVYLHALVAAPVAQRNRAVAHRREVAHHAVRAVAEVRWRLRHAVPLQVRRRGASHEGQGRDAARHQGLVSQFAGTDHAVDRIAYQVHRPVAHADLELDLRISRVERRKLRNQHHVKRQQRAVTRRARCGRLR